MGFRAASISPRLRTVNVAARGRRRAHTVGVGGAKLSSSGGTKLPSPSLAPPVFFSRHAALNFAAIACRPIGSAARLVRTTSPRFNESSAALAAFRSTRLLLGASRLACAADVSPSRRRLSFPTKQNTASRPSQTPPLHFHTIYFRHAESAATLSRP